jgi:hypothetical protein
MSHEIFFEYPTLSNFDHFIVATLFVLALGVLRNDLNLKLIRNVCIFNIAFNEILSLIVKFSTAKYIYGVCVLLFVIGIFDLRKQIERKSLVTNYFLFRQMGNVEDVMRETNLSEEHSTEAIKSLLKEGKVEMFLKSPQLYRWTENVDFLEGMTSEEIQI